MSMLRCLRRGDAGIITHLQTYMENGEYLRYLNTIAPKDTYVG